MDPPNEPGQTAEYYFYFRYTPTSEPGDGEYEYGAAAYISGRVIIAYG